MNDIAIPEKISKLQAVMLTMPQAQGLITEHYFAGGMYCRKLFRPAGTVIVGKVHKVSHFFICTKGEILVWSGEKTRRLLPGDVIESRPGTKRATYAVTDAIGMTVHKTDKTDVDEIEKELLEDEPEALFNAFNELKPEYLEFLEKIKQGELA